MNSWFAISAFFRSSATPASTSASRAETSGTAGICAAFTTLLSPRIRRPSHGTAPAAVCRVRALEGTPDIHGTNGQSMSIEENKAVVGRWFTEFWGKDFNPDVIGELAAPDIRFEYSLHAPVRGRDAVRAFAGKFRAAFP